MAQAELSDRARQVLKLLINNYIEAGEPVGSKVLAQYPELQFSSATIRHVMADLEESGFLTSPHTSAGRIPTAKGYRFYVDMLMTVQPLNEIELKWQQLYGEVHQPQALMKNVSNMLSNLTQKDVS